MFPVQWSPAQACFFNLSIRARTYPFHTLVPRGLLSRSWRYTQHPKAFVHAHTLFTHLCHLGSSPGPGDILSSQRHSCTHIPFSHTCATWAPLQVLAIYSAAKGIRARTYPFHTLVPRGLLSRSWRAWPLSAALHSTRLPLSAPTQVVTTSSTEVPAAGGGNSTAPAPWLKAGTSSLGASVPRTLHCAMPSHRSFNMSLT